MGTDSSTRRVAAGVVALLVAVAAAGLGWLLFVRLPRGDIARLLGVVLAAGLAVAGLRAGTRLAATALPRYNVAEVGVRGPISRSAAGAVPTGPVGASADDVVDQIERADESAAQALLLELNTPGGEVVPSDDLRLAVEDFDGPVVAYATDVCASGGYWIAAGCDHVVAREGSLVGSIGVIGSVVTAADLADRLGLAYERFAAGRYKDAGTPLREMDEEERAYLQGIVDDYYEAFVERVTDGRDLDAEAVRDTEARVFLGGEAAERGLVDAVGTREDAVEEIEARIDAPASVRAFEPAHPLSVRLGRAAGAAAGAATASVGRALESERFRLR